MRHLPQAAMASDVPKLHVTCPEHGARSGCGRGYIVAQSAHAGLPDDCPRRQCFGQTGFRHLWQATFAGDLPNAHVTCSEHGVCAGCEGGLMFPYSGAHCGHTGRPDCMVWPAWDRQMVLRHLWQAAMAGELPKAHVAWSEHGPRVGCG